MGEGEQWCLGGGLLLFKLAISKQMSPLPFHPGFFNHLFQTNWQEEKVIRTSHSTLYLVNSTVLTQKTKERPIKNLLVCIQNQSKIQGQAGINF